MGWTGSCRNSPAILPDPARSIAPNDVFRQSTVFPQKMLKPIRKLVLTDRPYYTSVSDDGRRFAVCTRSGKFLLFDHDLKQLDDRDFGDGVRWLRLDETGSLLVMGFQDHLEGFATAGNISPLFKLAVRRVSDPCCVLRSSERVLCIASWNKEPRLKAWDITSQNMIDETSLPHRGGAGYMLVPQPEGEAMAVIAYSGQSEEWMFWAHYARGKLRPFSQPEIEDVAFPCFHPTGRECVSYYERLGLCRMQFPSGELIASVQPEQALPHNPEDTFSYEVHFLRDDRFLVWQYNLALYEFDLSTLRPTAAVLTGVEGMTFGEDHFFSEGSWQLAGGRLPTSDCHHDQAFKNRTDTLRLWDASELSGQVSRPDPACPYTQALLVNRP